VQSLTRRFYARDAPEVAVDLIGKVLVLGHCAGRIVETEAYTDDDEASHSFRGPRRQNLVMFGPPGRLYVYRSYGVHWCANIVTGANDVGEAVLIRALEPVRGLPQMRARRGTARRDRDLANGPGKLTAAMGITGGHSGTKLGRGSVQVFDDGNRPGQMVQTTRIGITKAVDRPWRWYDGASECVSRR
jgi:DNA-3-methyladenine glycosylase